MMLTEYDEEKILRLTRRDAREEGEGRFGRLYLAMKADGRMKEFERAITDRALFSDLLTEYELDQRE